MFILHVKIKGEEHSGEWVFELPHKSVLTNTIRKETSYLATMEQGQPIFREALDHRNRLNLVGALNLSEEDICADLPLQVVSTGLPYLIVPIQNHLERVCINTPHFEQMLADIGAKFAYIIDVPQREGRTWDNGGRSEDIATGSAAGPVGAYLVKHGALPINEEIVLHQGRFVGRPSQLFVRIAGTRDNITSVKVCVEVCMVARGVFDPFEL